MGVVAIERYKSRGRYDPNRYSRSVSNNAARKPVDTAKRENRPRQQTSNAVVDASAAAALALQQREMNLARVQGFEEQLRLQQAQRMDNKPTPHHLTQNSVQIRNKSDGDAAHQYKLSQGSVTPPRSVDTFASLQSPFAPQQDQGKFSLREDSGRTMIGSDGQTKRIMRAPRTFVQRKVKPQREVPDLAHEYGRLERTIAPRRATRPKATVPNAVIARQMELLQEADHREIMKHQRPREPRNKLDRTRSVADRTNGLYSQYFVPHIRPTKQAQRGVAAPKNLAPDYNQNPQRVGRMVMPANRHRDSKVSAPAQFHRTQPTSNDTIKDPYKDGDQAKLARVSMPHIVRGERDGSNLNFNDKLPVNTFVPDAPLRHVKVVEVDTQQSHYFNDYQADKTVTTAPHWQPMRQDADPSGTEYHDYRKYASGTEGHSSLHAPNGSKGELAAAHVQREVMLPVNAQRARSGTSLAPVKQTTPHGDLEHRQWLGIYTAAAATEHNSLAVQKNHTDPSISGAVSMQTDRIPVFELGSTLILPVN